MRFTIEERHLTDTGGRPVSRTDAVSFVVLDADSVDDAVRNYAVQDSAEIIGEVLKFPGFQGVATVRKAGGVFTLQITPASGRVAE
ncbi:MAG TPA: hypothetical protein VMU84_18005 [Thermoanaerobaculia bacterium]|nr:hypothetical protein [Thermoanaerobaculia bacterium]